MDAVRTHHFPTVIAFNQISSIVLRILVRFLDTTACRRIITRNGKTNHGTVRQIDRTLYKSLSEGTATHYHAPVPILHSTGNNLARRSRIFVHQDHQFTELMLSVTIGIKVPTGAPTAFCVDNQFLLTQELIGYVNGSIQITSSITLQIENEILHSLSFQGSQCIHEFLVCSRCKTVNLDVTDLRSYHIRSIQTVHRNLVATDSEGKQLRNSPTQYLYIHLRTFWSLQATHDIFRTHLHTGYHRVVHHHDTVACQDSHLFRRSTRHRLNDKQGIFSHVELNTDTIEIALQGLVHAFHFFRCGIGGMRIQLFQHALDGALHELVIVYLIYI